MSKDPLRQSRAAEAIGAAGMGRGRDANTWELGTVISYNSGTHTAQVKTDSGRPLQNVPQLRPTFGGFDHLQTGATVVVSWNLGIPIIIGVIDMEGPPQTAIPSPTLTGVEITGQNDPTQPAEGLNNYKPPHAPTDMTGGDWAQVGTLGNHVAVLEGGVTLMGAPSAHVQSFGPSGMLRLVARRHEGQADFGTWRMENLEGRTSFVLRAGSNQTVETGLDEQHYTIRMDLGATGDVLDFSITEPQGRTLFKLHAGSDGKVQIYGDGGVDVSSGAGGDGTMRHDVAGDRSTTIVGDDTHSVKGNSTANIDGDATNNIAGDHSHVTGGDATRYVSGTETAGVAGDATHVLGGDCTVAIAKDTTINSLGAMTVNAAKDVSLKTFTNISVSAAATSKIDGTHVILGAQGAHPLPLFDVFLQDLAQFLTSTLPSLIGALTPSDPFGLAAALSQCLVYGAKVSSMVPYVSTKVSND